MKCLLFLFAFSCVTVFGQADSLRRYAFAHPQMGTVFRLVFYAADDSLAARAARAAFARIDELNQILSDYQADSELSRLSATAGSGRAVRVSRDLWRVLLTAQQAARLSDGAFDITVGPVVRLWRRARRQHELPDPASLAEARRAVSYKYIELQPKARTAKLTQPDMQLDAGGIGKGYAADEALQTLQQLGIRAAMVDGSGNLALGDAPPNRKGWRVAAGIGASGDTTRAVYLDLANTGVSTSGDLFQFVEINGKRYSHIVNPRTGYGLTTSRLVSVTAPDATTADWLSTALCVMSPAKASRMLRRMSGVKVWRF
ncbi:MAG: FAD:protein FMN transferase [Cytophagales bacterium]|nr:FAD:protein FMN transferase [Cytophagales bacterium]